LPAQEDAGIMPSWEVEAIASELEADVVQVEKLLGEVQPTAWSQGGAAAYGAQREALMKELGYLRDSALAMGRRPENLPYVIDTFLWIERTNSMLVSVTDGVRRY